MLASILPIAVLAQLMGCLNSITVTTPQKFINVTSGETAVLDCTFTTSLPTTFLNIDWSFVSASTMMSQQIYYYQAGQTAIPEKYKNRLIPPQSPNITKNASISITNMSPSDSGTYSCVIHNMPDTDGPNEGNIILTVLEKPSAAFCVIHGTVESGHRIALICHSARGNPAPTYTWTRLGQSTTRSSLLSTNWMSGVLQIGNLSQFEFGEYQCNASNAIGFSTCTVEIKEELPHGAVAGAVIGGLLGAGLIIFLVWYITHRMKKKRSMEMKAAAGSEMQARPQREGSAGYESVPTTEGRQASVSVAPAPAESASSHKPQEEPDA